MILSLLLGLYKNILVILIAFLFIYAVQAGANVASWMLDITGAGISNKSSPSSRSATPVSGGMKPLEIESSEVFETKDKYSPAVDLSSTFSDHFDENLRRFFPELFCFFSHAAVSYHYFNYFCASQRCF
jgi:hypothetical protein